MEERLPRTGEVEPQLRALFEKIAVLLLGPFHHPAHLEPVVEIPLVAPPEVAGAALEPAITDPRDEAEVRAEVVAEIRVLDEDEVLPLRANVLQVEGMSGDRLRSNLELVLHRLRVACSRQRRVDRELVGLGRPEDPIGAHDPVEVAVGTLTVCEHRADGRVGPEVESVAADGRGVGAVERSPR